MRFWKEICTSVKNWIQKNSMSIFVFYDLSSKNKSLVINGTIFYIFIWHLWAEEVGSTDRQHLWAGEIRNTREHLLSRRSKKYRQGTPLSRRSKKYRQRAYLLICRLFLEENSSTREKQHYKLRSWLKMVKNLFIFVFLFIKRHSNGLSGDIDLKDW